MMAMDQNPQNACPLSRPEADRLLSQWHGRAVVCTGITRLHGCGGSTVQRLDFDCPPFHAVAKVDGDPAITLLPREKANIELVRKLTKLPAPKVYLEDCTRAQFPFSVLLLEFLPGVSMESVELTAEQRHQVSLELAEMVMELHTHTRELFGQAQGGLQYPRWSEVFLPKLVELRQDMVGQLPESALGNIDVALAAAPALFAESGPATLVHGDLWAGNILIQPEYQRCRISGLVDWAALQYADVEYELAYLTAWSTVTPTFSAQYAEVNPPRAGHETRRLFYWLHTYMLHVWLFGAQRYGKLAADTAERIARRLAGSRTTSRSREETHP
jgi:fructosamine-3-kinase